MPDTRLRAARSARRPELRPGEGRKGRESGWEGGAKGPVVGDTHRQLPQPLKDKGQGSISGAPGSRRKRRPWFPQACGRLINLCGRSGHTQNRLRASSPRPTLLLSPPRPGHMRETSCLPSEHDQAPGLSLRTSDQPPPAWLPPASDTQLGARCGRTVALTKSQLQFPG